MSGVIILICLFQYSVGLMLSYALGTDTSLTLRVLAALCAFYSIVYFIVNLHGSKKQVVRSNALIVFFTVGFGLVVTALINGGVNSMMRTYLLSFFSSGLTGVLLGVSISKKKISLIFKWIIPFSIVCTVILLLCVKENRGVIINDFSGIDSQQLSYAGAYCFSLVLFYIVNSDTIEMQNLFAHRRVWYMICVIVLVADVYVVFAGGGRGAVVTLIVMLAYCFRKKLKLFSLKSFITVITLCSIAYIGLKFLSSSQNISGGYGYIAKLFKGGIANDKSSLQRLLLYRNAFVAAKDSFFIGNGLGGTAYTVGFYTHNFFTDVLVDCGFGGIVISAIILVKTFKIGLQRSDDIVYQFVFLLFLSTFVSLMFSKSWIYDTVFWFSIIAIRMIAALEYECTLQIN